MCPIGRCAFRSGRSRVHTCGVTPDQCLAQVTRDQLGLFTTRQAITAGFTPRQLDRRVAAGRLDYLGQGMYGLAGHAPSWERTVQAAVLAVGDEAVVAHLAAARLLALAG